MRVIIVDDEKEGIENLRYYLSQYDCIKILGMYQSALEGIQSIIKEKPDVVFIDIMMPQMGGIQAASEILKYDHEIRIVFVTSFDEYAIKAFELNAIDYVLKPFSRERIEATIKRIDKYLIGKDLAENIKRQEAIQCEAMKKEIIKIPAWKNDRIVLCDPLDIGFFSAEDGEVKIYSCNGECYTSKDTLNYFNIKLEQKKFFRCHKSFIVNILKVNEIEPWFNNTYTLKLEGLKERVPVSRSYMKNFKKLFDL